MHSVAAVLVTALLAIVLYHAALLRRKKIAAFVRGGEYAAFAAYYCLFVYAVYAGTFGLPFPEALIRPWFTGSFPEGAGAALCLAGVAGYAVSAAHLRDSYRIGIDETTPGPLVTSGIFAHSRNPIYISLLSLYLGLFCVYANAALLINLALSVAIIHRQVLREEKFLRELRKDAYLEYCARVPRYL